MPRYTLGIDVGDGLFVVMDNGVDTKAIASAKAVFSDSVEIKDGEFHGGEFHGGWLPVQIQGSKAFVNCPDGEHIKIGCQAYTPEHWAEHYVAIGKAHGYSDEQIEEYKGYIDLVSAMIAKSKSKGE